MSPFGCDECGCPSIRAPSALENDGDVHCRRCGKVLMTWGTFKAWCEQDPASRSHSLLSRDKEQRN
jgi:uncharacterized Zn finger protein (UPF0148 family)